MTESEQLKINDKRRAQQIQKIQDDATGRPAQQDLGSPAEDDGEDATTVFAHEVKRAERRAARALPHGSRPR